MSSRLTAMLLVLVLLGGNAAVIQVAAWASMLVERAQRMDWGDAVASTFSGRQPCQMCRAADRLRDDGPSVPASMTKLLKKAEAVPLATVLAVVAATSAALPDFVCPLDQPVVHRPAPEPPPPQAG